MRVELPSGRDSIAGELRLPARTPAPGIVVLHDVWGLSPVYEKVAQRLADAGFAALALDLYARGEKPGSPADMPGVMRFMHELPDHRVLADVQAAADWLRARPEVAGRKVGLTGFCMGGKYAFLAAARCRGLAAVAPWYGMLRARELDEANPEHALDALAELRAPVLALFGEDDALIPQTDVQELRRLAAARGLPLEIVVYPGAGHAFANESRPEVYREAAAQDAWRRALEFFAKQLGAGQ
ncbi:MAG TPA: dienelactone hydrolase family protein [Myxococcota bacterium]|nr:dienelactone hydrolase family protein [Myxococcota bacterium]